MAQDPFAAYPHIQSNGLLLRKIEPGDLDALAEILMNERLFRFTPGNPRKTKAAVQNMIGHFERDFQKRKTIFLGICLADAPGRVVGIAEVFDYDKAVHRVTIGYRLNEACWSRGIATRAVTLLTDYLFTTVGLNRVQAFVMPENEKSHAVLLRCGFQKEGTLRQNAVWSGKGVVDLTVYALLRAEWKQ